MTTSPTRRHLEAMITPTLRPMQAADASAVAALQNAACRGLWHITPAEVLAQTGQRRVVEQAGHLVGGARLYPFGLGAEDALRLSLCGDAAHFSALYLHLLAAADLSGCTRVLGVVREDWAEQVGFFQAAGFANVWQTYGARLDLTGFDFARFAPELERLYLEGHEIREWPADGDAAQLYALDQQFQADAPATPVTPTAHRPLSAFAEELRRQRTWVLWRGDEPLAFTTFHAPYGIPDSAGTVTRRGERGRGLAAALKAHALEELRREGNTQTSTGGAVANLPMLRVNLRLGYCPEPMWLTFERPL
ncbi:GNAT family N-acetyltransferase [Deinococcus radiophilus]|uniref:N-acetyltransferase domain-containing protein n=2 Tax=Deinococcus radiophilus TaxID=32062 RepID=A0A3S0KBK4_9DEIO|nr:GNAT family N-acetyltransferase [Deinococcus radiophilus]RTR27070.1 hypothetical protein EJ104_07275 [Deinococcus radiophilus]